MSEGEPSTADVPDGQRSVARGSLDGPGKTRGGGRSSRALRTGLVSAERAVTPRRRCPCVRVDRGSDARPFGHARAAEWRFVPLVRRSERRAGLDPRRRSGSGTDPPVFYGGKPGKSLTAIPIMDSEAQDWKLQTEFARGYMALTKRTCCSAVLNGRLPPWPEKRSAVPSPSNVLNRCAEPVDSTGTCYPNSESNAAALICENSFTHQN